MRNVSLGLVATFCLICGITLAQNAQRDNQTPGTQPGAAGQKQGEPAGQGQFGPVATQPGQAGQPAQLNAQGQAVGQRVQVAQPGQPAAVAGQHANSADQQIAAVIAGCQNNEIQISKFAQNRLQSQEAKHFAEMMIKDHGEDVKGYERLAGNLANAHSSGQRTGGQADWVAIHHEVGQQSLKGIEEELGKQQQGADFDKGYIAQQIDAHLKTKAELTAFRNHVSSETQQQIDKSLQAVNTHLQHARQIMEQLKERPSERVSRNPK